MEKLGHFFWVPLLLECSFSPCRVIVGFLTLKMWTWPNLFEPQKSNLYSALLCVVRSHIYVGYFIDLILECGPTKSGMPCHSAQFEGAVISTAWEEGAVGQGRQSEPLF